MSDLPHDERYAQAARFLREQEASLQADLANTERRIREATQAGRETDLLEARRAYLERERAVLGELGEEIAGRELEQALGSRLKRLQEAMFYAAPHPNPGHYPHEFWEREVEQGILNELLQKWLVWKHRMSAP